jgi:Mg2+-importing ATPase
MTRAASTEPAFWARPIDELFVSLGTSAAGLTGDEADRRLAEHGPNLAVPPRRNGFLTGLANQFASPISVLLIVAAVLSLALGERVDGEIILGILTVSGALGFWQERRAAGAVERLLAIIRTSATVLRDGREQEVPLKTIVPGDIVRLVAGASVPGDARLIDAKDLFVDQAMLTGESYPAEKAVGLAADDAPLAARPNVLYLGTHVVSGTGSALVVRTGKDTEFGAIAQRLSLRPAETEFEHGVRRFGYLLLEIATVLVIVIFTVNVALHRPVLDALLFTLALAVGLTPQLLPAIVSVTLSYGARRMAAEHVIVRRLAAIEDLGGMQILCTDKTGTITEGVVAIHEAIDWAGTASAHVRLLAYLNAAFETGFPNPIDDALRASPPPGADAYTKVDEVPYDFTRKRLSVAVLDRDRTLLVTKGALANILDVCDRAVDVAGRLTPIGDVRAALDARFEALSRDGYRCLGVAYRELTSTGPLQRTDERDLVFAGIIDFADPLKPHVAETMRELAQLGIAVKVITGDNRHVAARLAAEAGIGATRVCTGDELDQLSEAALVNVAPTVAVFAEVEPRQKERIIRALKKGGRAVGYLGDGINDAPALHAADVGISVDTATDVTKQAADVVLLEKDLGVLSRGVREGRRAFANTLKYVFIATSANFGNMFSMAGASLLLSFLPLLPKQILLINLLSDLPAMAIATDWLDPELVQQPRRWDNRGIRRFMLAFGLVSSFFDYLTFGVLVWFTASPATFRTGWFTESVLSAIFVLLVIRTRRWFYRSRVGTALLWMSAAVACIVVLLPRTELGAPFELVPLPGRLLALVLGIVALYVLTAEASKRLIFRRASL